MRDFDYGFNSSGRLSVHFNTTYGNYTAQINGRIQTVQIPQNATTYEIIDPFYNSDFKYLNYTLKNYTYV